MRNATNWLEVFRHRPACRLLGKYALIRGNGEFAGGSVRKFVDLEVVGSFPTSHPIFPNVIDGSGKSTTRFDIFPGYG